MLHQAVQLLRLDLRSLVSVILLAHFVVQWGSIQFEVFVKVREVNFVDERLDAQTPVRRSPTGVHRVKGHRGAPVVLEAVQRGEEVCVLWRI